VIGSPFRTEIFPLPPSSTTSVFVGAAVTIGTAGLRSVFFISSRDMFSNKRFNASDFSASSLSIVPSFFESVVLNHVNGDIFSVEYLFTRSGSYLMSAFVNLDPIRGCPVNLTISPSVVCAAKTYLSSSSLSIFYAGSASTFSIIALDDFGNKLSDGGLVFVVTIKSKVYTTYKATDMLDGTYRYNVMLTKVEAFLWKCHFRPSFQSNLLL